MARFPQKVSSHWSNFDVEEEEVAHVARSGGWQRWRLMDNDTQKCAPPGQVAARSSAWVPTPAAYWVGMTDALSGRTPYRPQSAAAMSSSPVRTVRPTSSMTGRDGHEAPYIDEAMPSWAEADQTFSPVVRPRKPMRLQPVQDKAMAAAVAKLHHRFDLASKRKSRIAKQMAARRMVDAHTRRAEEAAKAEEEQLESSATQLQATFRGHKGRKDTLQKKLMRRSAITIQARFRGKLARTRQMIGEINPTTLEDLWSAYKVDHRSNHVPIQSLAQFLWQCLEHGLSSDISKIVPQAPSPLLSAAGVGVSHDPSKAQVARLLALHLPHHLGQGQGWAELLNQGEEAELPSAVEKGQSRWAVIERSLEEAEVLCGQETNSLKIWEAFSVDHKCTVTLKEFRAVMADLQVLMHLDEEHLTLALAFVQNRRFELSRMAAETIARMAVRKKQYKPYRWKLKAKAFVRLFRFMFRNPAYFDNFDEDSDEDEEEEEIEAFDDARLQDQVEAETADEDLREKMETLFLETMVEMPKIIEQRKQPRDRIERSGLTRYPTPEPALSPDDLDELVKLVDRNRDEMLNAKEFKELVLLICKKRKMIVPPERIIVETFQDFDPDQSGTIDGGEIHAVCFQLQLKIQAIRELEGRAQLAVMLEIFYFDVFRKEFKSPLDLSMAIICQSRSWQSASEPKARPGGR